jgi:SecD/SecF fusion protein
MQLKGLVRFFTVLLILYSLYQLSFTWVVRSHEKKLEAKAKSFVKNNYTAAVQKYPSDKLQQQLYEDTLTKIYNQKLKDYKDSTSDKTLHYGPQGAISYQKAKENELNLGLDLQGGMNVTMEVELSGLVKAMSNNSKDPTFLKAIDNANIRKANSGADFVTLFGEEYEKLNPGGKLAGLFSISNPDLIKLDDSNSKVLSAIKGEARKAFDRTYRVLTNRIDQFGVAQPAINPDPSKGIINVELPGIQDKERVRKYLQSSANLQFWEVYTLGEQALQTGLQKADETYKVLVGGGAVAKNVIDTTKPVVPDTTKNKRPDVPKVDTNKGIKKFSDVTGNDKKTVDTPGNKSTTRSLFELLSPSQPRRLDDGSTKFSSEIGYVALKDTGVLSRYLNSDAFRMLFPGDLVWMYGVTETDKNGAKNKFVPIYAIKTNGKEKAELEGDAIRNATHGYDQFGKVEITMNMNSSGARKWADLTGRNVNKPIAIALDNLVYSAPNVESQITGGSSRISGSYTIEQAEDLSNILKSGKLPAPAKIVAEEQVGPTLGAKAIRGGAMSFAISFIVIFLLMLVYYNTGGWIANIALILNLLFTIGVLTGLGATLTAPGIAGLVLTIGMAVDTNVIIYERIKEELTKGKSYIAAVNEGYRRSLPPVLDAHVTTFLTAVILFSFGLGPVKGFATTQMIGISLSLFCGILVSRWVTDWFTTKKKHLEYFTGVSRRVFKHAAFKFIEYRKYAYGISVIVLLLGVGSFFNGFNQGVEFKGGRSFQIEFGAGNKMDSKKIEQLRDELKVVFNESPTIKTVSSQSRLDITTSYLIADPRPQEVVDSLSEAKLFEGLKKYLPANLPYSKFDTEYKIGSKKILPTISDDLKRGAVKATIFSILIIMLYIFIRFRDWRYSAGTIVALLHDVFVTLAVFSFLKNLVPFPLEIDQHFIAAVLTVIGFSMNDTVIVFDRIREYSREMKGVSKTTIINKAINDTLSRTIMTSLTVFLTLLILFIFGGEVTRGFAFAMLIGVITGTYSSIFVAAPILVDIAKDKPLAGMTETQPAAVSTTTATKIKA